MKNIKTNNILKSRSGFSLVELIVAMGVFIIVIVIASDAFLLIVNQATKFMKSEESNIEGVIGLEVMRHDLEQMGYGLPWGWCKRDTVTGYLIPNQDNPTAVTVTYNESTDATGLLLNDTTNGSSNTGNPPRALAGRAAAGAFSSDYIGIKATTVGRSKAAQNFTYIPFHNYSASGGRESRPIQMASNNPKVGDKVILINSNHNDAANLDRKLIVDPTSSNIFHIIFNNTGGIVDDYLPTDDKQSFMVYGIDGTTDPMMPFNRSDFFIKVPSGTASTDGSLPAFCAPSTGVLYKATVNHVGGGYTYIPLVDCVADMQVVLGWDTSEDSKSGITAFTTLPDNSGNVSAVLTRKTGNVNTSTEAATLVKSWLTTATTAAEDVRKHLKVVKVYILAQEGKRDRGYKSPSTTITVGDLIDNGGLSQKVYTLSAAQQEYRWKLYRIVVRPKNLSSNQ